MNSLVTVQIDAGTTDLVGNVRSNLVTDVNNGNILVRVPHTVALPAQPLMLHACACLRKWGTMKPVGRFALTCCVGGACRAAASLRA